MSESVAQRFMDALRDAERRRDPEPLVALFGDDAEASTLTRERPARGRDAIRRFWSDYLDQFQQIESEFTGVLTTHAGAALEWRSRGVLRDGRPIEYHGVSLLEFDGGRVRRFRTYFDTSPFAPVHAATHG
jgi:ketosteroid isomerase-like protein